MEYELVYTQRAARDIAKLDQSTQERTQKTLERYDIEDTLIVVLRIGHRREIYRDAS